VVLAPNSFMHGLGIVPLASTVHPILQSTVSNHLVPASSQAHASNLIAVDGNFPCAEQCKGRSPLFVLICNEEVG